MALTQTASVGSEAQVEVGVLPLRDRIAELEAEVEALRAAKWVANKPNRRNARLLPVFRCIDDRNSYL